MYINLFWCGVAATLIVETVAVIVMSMIIDAKNKKK